MTDSSPTQLEVDQETLDIIHELVLRGLRETEPTEREYGDAYDTFVEAAGYPLQIGDQPERVQNVWEDIMEGEPRDLRNESSPMNQWKCAHCGWTGTNPGWDRHEHRRLCPECDDPVEREVS